MSSSNSDAAANTGARSLLTANRTAGFHGPSIGLLGVLERDVPCRIRVSVRLTAPPPAPAPQVRMTVQRTPTGAMSAFDTVATSNAVTDAGFTTLVDVPVHDRRLGVAPLRGEHGRHGVRTTSTIFGSRRLSDQSGFSCGFEDTTGTRASTASPPRRGWTGRGPARLAVLTNTDADAHGGTRSVLATGRTATFNGPALDITGKMTRGFRYRVRCG